MKYYSKPNKSRSINRSNKYIIQIGAFSTYNSALRAAYNVAKYRSSRGVLSNDKVEIVEKSNFYMARFRNLSKKDATKMCTSLKQKGQDCFLVAQS